jgi:hypothetical protein
MDYQDIKPARFIQYCGADCRECDTYQRFIRGEDVTLCDREQKYRCCWLPDDYPRGGDCYIKACCVKRHVSFCGACAQFAECATMKEFYAQPGYDVLKKRMLEQLKKRHGK